MIYDSSEKAPPLLPRALIGEKVICPLETGHQRVSNTEIPIYRTNGTFLVEDLKGLIGISSTYLFFSVFCCLH